MTCDDLPFINTTRKTLQPSKKWLNSQDGWEKTSYQGIPAEGYQAETWDESCFKTVFQTLATYRHWKRYFFKYL